MELHGGFRLLLDSNVLIALDPLGREPERLAALAVELHRLATEQRHVIYRHPAGMRDFHRHTDPRHRENRALLARKFPLLPSPPEVPSAWLTRGRPPASKNDAVDMEHLAAINAHAIDYLVTEDRRLRERAIGLRLDDRLLTVAEAVEMLRSLQGEMPASPPAVEHLKVHALDSGDAIFDSLREDYPDFDDWLRKCAREHRDAWIIRKSDRLAAIAITKLEVDGGDSGWTEPSLKICTFKVSDQYGGFRYGELLLKALFDFRRTTSAASTYATTYPKQKGLISLFTVFGFERGGRRGSELVLRKRFHPADTSLDPLRFHILHGPPAVKLQPGQVFIVPIEPRFHRMLFPDAERQGSLFAGQDAFGNALKKAYLSNASIRSMMPGATLLFYRSDDVQGITAVGVLERTIRSRDPREVATLTSARTVFPFREIIELSQRGEILALLFRQDRFVNPPLELGDLVRNRVVRGAPQSIQGVGEEGFEWLRARIETLH